MIYPWEIFQVFSSQIPERLRRRVIGGFIVLAMLLGLAALAFLLFGTPVEGIQAKDLAGAFGAAAGTVIAVAAQVVTSFERAAQSVKIEAVEQRVREHPEKPQLAWDLARTKLESYLDRNLSQVRDIFWLTLVVMIAGFSLIVYGLQQSFSHPAALNVSLVASASGVLISFIGGSFLLIYRSILAQSKEYVAVLERINAVGMAVQVLASMSDESAAIRDKSTADLSRTAPGGLRPVGRGVAGDQPSPTDGNTASKPSFDAPKLGSAGRLPTDRTDDALSVARQRNATARAFLAWATAVFYELSKPLWSGQHQKIPFGRRARGVVEAMCFSKNQLCSLPLGACHRRLTRFQSQSHQLDQFALR